MKNTATSVRAKLLNLSRAKGVPLNALMEQYATGRFLYRLAQSRHREHFVLKGAQLFRVWEAEEHRPTRYRSAKALRAFAGGGPSLARVSVAGCLINFPLLT